MIKVGITGQYGFIGTHLFNTLGLYPNKFERIPFKDEFFQDEVQLRNFISQCDIIVHLAAMNRHNDPQVLYETNLKLVKLLIDACEASKVAPHIIFSSSTQEEKDNLYGKSKREGRELFLSWANRNQAKFTGLIIPNVFGPFGHPYYNSVVATFCHQLTHNETPKIDFDSELNLIYVGELIEEIISIILLHNDPLNVVPNRPEMITGQFSATIKVAPRYTIQVSELLKKVTDFKVKYFEKGEIPELNSPFDLKLFNTFLCYIDHSTFFPFPLKVNKDHRGSFTEIVKLNSGGQVSFSSTVPGVTRGNHFHTRKVERFAVIKGKARIQLRRIGTNKVLTFDLEGDRPAFVDMPIWHTHNITNIGDDELFTVFWTNEHFSPNDPDTYPEAV